LSDRYIQATRQAVPVERPAIMPAGPSSSSSSASSASSAGGFSGGSSGPSPTFGEYLNVEICATLLTDKPPKLPLREELPSLGFEVIYNGDGVGARTAMYEADRAVKRYQKAVQVKEMKKRRIFPRSPSKIKRTLAERKRIERDLQMPHAFSYESYEFQLYAEAGSGSGKKGFAGDHGSVASSRSGATSVSTLREKEWYASSSSTRNRMKKVGKKVSSTSMMKQKRKLQEKKGWIDFFRKAKSADYCDGEEDDEFAVSVDLSSQNQQSLEDVFGRAGFADILDDDETTTTTARDHGTATTGTNTTPNKKRSDSRQRRRPTTDDEKRTVGSTTMSGGTHPSSTDANDFDAAYKVTFPTGEARDGAVQNMEIEFASKAAALDNVKKEEKVEATLGGYRDHSGLGEAIRNAFAGLGSSFDWPTESQQQPQQQNAIDSPLQKTGGTKDVANKKANEIHKAFQNVPADIYVASALRALKASDIPVDSNRDSEDGPPRVIDIRKHGKSMFDDASVSTCGSVKTVFEAIGCANTPAREVEKFVSSFPDMAKVKQTDDSRFPLHVLCDRGMPDRSRIEDSELTKLLVEDIDSYRNIVGKLVRAYPEACLEKDRNGDLPVHLLSRSLMQWEAVWYETVYTQAAQERNPLGKTACNISQLYLSMSETVGYVLESVPSDTSLCREPGSIGKILPLHIACIFTSSVRTLRLILGAYPDAAKVPCDLGGLRTFVPENALPLELHEGLSTDFPKWEVEKKHERHHDVDWSQSRNDSSPPVSEDCIRRSDLLFAYNPNIEPFRFEKARIRRLESRIRFEATKFVNGHCEPLSGPARLVWIWFCTFQEGTDMRPTYIKSVQRVVDGLPVDALRNLASVEVAPGQLLMKAANSQCTKIMRKSLGEQTWESLSERDSKPQTGSDVSSGTKFWSESSESRLPRQGRTEVTLLCRNIFNVKEESFPTAFIILPYQLAQSADGKLGMASPSSAPVAMKFAECLLRLTDPRSILYFLDLKSIKHYDQSIYEDADDQSARQEAYKKIRENEATLLGLFGYEQAYLYLIDEVTGIPVMLDSDKTYPIVIREPASMVQKLLPMMLIGMILMRGDKALSVLANVLLDGTVTVVAPNWIQAAKDLRQYLETEKESELSLVTNAAQLKADVDSFLAKAASKRRSLEKPKNGSSEWTVEVSILKMLLDMNDGQRSFCGLHSEFIRDRGVIWRSQAPYKQYEETEEEKLELISLESRIARIKEVRRRFDKTMRGRENDVQVPDVDELSQKHDELTRMYEDITYTSDATPLGFPQPVGGEVSDEDRRRRIINRALSDFNESSDDETIKRLLEDKIFMETLPIQIYDSSDDTSAHQPKPGLKGKRVQKPHIAENRDTSGDVIQQETPVWMENAEEPDYASLEGGLCGRSYSLLFDELAFSNSYEKGDIRNPIDLSREVGNESARVWQEIKEQLENSGMYYEDAQVIRLKVQLAQEAKRLSFMNKQVKVIEREKDILLGERNDRIGTWIEQSEIDLHFDLSLKKARQLLVRLCALEERLLVDEIEMQHLKLATLSLDENITCLDHERRAPPKLSSARARHRRAAAKASRSTVKASRSPKVHFQEPVVHNVEQSDDSYCDGGFPVDEIDLIELDDVSAASGHSGLKHGSARSMNYWDNCHPVQL